MADNCAPRAGDRILVFRPDSLAWMLSGKKTTDARKTNYKPGRYLLGCNGRIYAIAVLRRAIVVESVRTWDRLRRHHRSRQRAPPYSPKTFVFQIFVLKKFPPLPCQHPQGAINVVEYRP